MISSLMKKKDIMSISIFIYVFALSVSRWNAIYSISCVFLLMTMVGFAIKKRRIFKLELPDKRFHFIYWPFFVFLFISSVLLGDWPSIKSAFNFFYWSIPFVILYIACQYKRNDELIINALALALWVTSGKAIQQYLTADTVIRVTGFFGGPNDLATMLCLNMTFLLSITIGKQFTLSKYTRISSYGSFILGLIAFMLTGSRAGMIAFILGGVITFQIYMYCADLKLTRRKKGILLGSVVVIVLFFIGGMLVTQNRQIRQHYDSERVKLLISAYEMWDDHKLLGVGLKNWGKEYHENYIRPDAREPNLDIPHNVPAYFFSSAGTVAGLAYLLYSFGIFWYMYKEMKKNPSNPYIYGFLWAAIAVFMHGVVDSGITTNNVLKLYSGLLGITMVTILGEHAEKK